MRAANPPFTRIDYRWMAERLRRQASRSLDRSYLKSSRLAPWRPIHGVSDPSRGFSR